ncbi:MAG: hypothetical protein M3Z04_04570 [Chloroflexota bacterium]|nr:hypothetical protein [Chloroflexota bacterium]
MSTRNSRSESHDVANECLSADFAGAAAQYGDTLLFIGFDLGDGQFQITVYPGYRFPSDDRVHGHIGIFDVPIGTAWPEILRRVDRIEANAQRNYQRCVQFRSGGRSRSGGRGSDQGADHVAETFRESWAGFRLKLAREGRVTRGDVDFEGDPKRAFLARWNAREYTVRVYDSGSMLVLPGDRRSEVP